MKLPKEKLSKSQIQSLKARWNQPGRDGSQSLAQEMVQQLKTECRKSSLDRPTRLDLRGIPLFNEELSNLDLSRYDFSYASLNGCNFFGTNFSYSICHDTHMEQTTLDECEFLGSDMTHANLNECTAKQCGFGGTDLSHASLINADLTEAAFSHSTLIHADLRASNLTRARLTEADLSHAILTRANLSESDLKNSRVAGTTFELADMKGCRVSGIKSFKKASWIGVDIRDLDFRGAYLVRRYIADENYLFEFKSKSRMNHLIYLVWRATSDCGRSLSRWFFCLLLATLTFSAIYTMVEIDYGDYKTVFSPLYFSIVTLTTLGYGDAVPMSIPAQIFVTLQAISGYMGLGGLLSILGNKMARRAE